MACWLGFEMACAREVGCLRAAAGQLQPQRVSRGGAPLADVTTVHVQCTLGVFSSGGDVTGCVQVAVQNQVWT